MDCIKVALFDFCETLANFQTADAFVDFVRNHSNSHIMKSKEKMWLFMRKSRLMSVLDLVTKKQNSKRIKLHQLKGIKKNELEDLSQEYYKQRIRPNLIRPILNRMLSLKHEGYTIGLVSGGYGIYLKYFVEEFKIDFCISSELDFKGDYCTGKMRGLDCMNQNKVMLLNRYFKEKPFKSIAFSDSITDIPFLQWTKEGVVVSRNHQKWIENYNFSEIIWVNEKN